MNDTHQTLAYVDDVNLRGNALMANVKERKDLHMEFYIYQFFSILCLPICYVVLEVFQLNVKIRNNI